MSAHNLWAVWRQNEDAFVRSGMSSRVSQGWALASEGDRGLAEIAPSAGRGFLMAMCLTDLRSSWAVMGQVERGLFSVSADRWLPYAPTTYVVLIQGGNGEKTWTPIRAKNEAQAHTIASSLGKVIASGKVDDLKRVLDEGEQILLEKKYEKVLVDVRPVTKEHPHSWLPARQSPHLASSLSELFDR